MLLLPLLPIEVIPSSYCLEIDLPMLKGQVIESLDVRINRIGGEKWVVLVVKNTGQRTIVVDGLEALVGYIWVVLVIPWVNPRRHRTSLDATSVHVQNLDKKRIY